MEQNGSQCPTQPTRKTKKTVKVSPKKKSKHTKQRFVARDASNGKLGAEDGSAGVRSFWAVSVEQPEEYPPMDNDLVKQLQTDPGVNEQYERYQKVIQDTNTPDSGNVHDGLANMDQTIFTESMEQEQAPESPLTPLDEDLVHQLVTSTSIGSFSEDEMDAEGGSRGPTTSDKSRRDGMGADTEPEGKDADVTEGSPSTSTAGDNDPNERPIGVEAESADATALSARDLETILDALGPTVRYYRVAPCEIRLLLGLRGEKDSDFPGLSSALGDKRSQKILTKELLREVAKVRCKYFKSFKHDPGTRGRAIVPSQKNKEQLEKWLYENPIVLDEEKPYLRKELRILTDQWGITKPESQEDASEPDAEYKDWEPKAKESKFNALLRSFCQFTISPLVWIAKKLRGGKQSS